MKTAWILLAAALVAGPVAAGAGGDAGLAPSLNAFAVDLYRTVRTDDGNLFFSPASVGYALGMTRAGARGATAAEMDAVLHLPRGGGNSAAFGALMGGLLAADAPYTLRLANRLYGQVGLSFEPGFRAEIAEHFRGGLAEVDFVRDAEGARGAVNGWVSEQTAERIPELLGPGAVDARTRLVLVNAIYFLADWRAPFPADGTRPRPFHLTDGTAVDVPTMSETLQAGYAAPEGLQVLALPYEGDVLEMVVLLPAQETGLAEVEARLDASTLAAWLAAPEPARVQVLLPRFEFTTEFRLGRTLAELGMPTAFTDRADFSGMVAAGRLAVDDVIHEAYVRVDEKGTEAAAATGVVMRVTSLPPPPKAVFQADRPFLLVIRHKPSGALLFLGRVTDPRT